MKTDIIWPESILKATPEALQRIADSKLVARNLRDIFPHPYTLDDAVAFLDNVRQGKMGIVYGFFHTLILWTMLWPFLTTSDRGKWE